MHNVTADYQSEFRPNACSAATDRIFCMLQTLEKKVL